ncbi:helix-turn-helix domain-containing protein [uncultured Hyphomicrobium sp.]|jgi:protein-tyrosine-phosphatase/DNA-binding transcriptional ArsR family regulator|uniref:arsenate reductase/protein-tyrosine-phosphatase family protein n=1 Tax=uncultured Hyphomicrobium sp. TaxID=194373 RepID=UPI0025DF5165|nr:helix-turn-helix domain-containing protein [uncultured Hyphomicrobium sp.]
MNGNDRLSAAETAAIFAALSQETRLEAYRLLLRYQPFGLAAGDIARLLAVPHNTMSTHMSLLQNAGLVRSRREGRSIIFAANPLRLVAAEAFLDQGRAGVPSRKAAPTPKAQLVAYPRKRSEEDLSQKRYNVLVLCTGNTARSIMAEAILNREGQGLFQAYSAGSNPKSKANPIGLELLAGLGYETTGLRSKSWTEFAKPGAPKMDFIITVCDKAAGETCPHWPGHPLAAHWGIADPAAVSGSADEKRRAFQEAYRQLMNRLTAFINLPIDDLSLADLKTRLAEIGRMEGATQLTLAGRAA